MCVYMDKMFFLWLSSRLNSWVVFFKPIAPTVGKMLPWLSDDTSAKSGVVWGLGN